MYELLEEQGMKFRFVAKISWEKGKDSMAESTLGRLFNKKILPENFGIHRKSMEGFLLIGQREVILFGQASSEKSLQQFNQLITSDSELEAKFYHGVDLHTLKEMYGKPGPAKKRKR